MGRGLLYIDFFYRLQLISVVSQHRKNHLRTCSHFRHVLYRRYGDKRARQSVQFIIFSQKFDEIASHINTELHRGCTVLDGWDGIRNNRKRYLSCLPAKQKLIQFSGW
jgi:uncharacterized membrane-anchored protein YitT (DUF2179 family)